MASMIFPDPAAHLTGPTPRPSYCLFAPYPTPTTQTGAVWLLLMTAHSLRFGMPERGRFNNANLDAAIKLGFPVYLETAVLEELP